MNNEKPKSEFESFLLQENSSKLGSSLLHDLERTGFILAGQVENDTLNFNDSLLNLTVLSRPRYSYAGRRISCDVS